MGEMSLQRNMHFAEFHAMERCTAAPSREIFVLILADKREEGYTLYI